MGTGKTNTLIMAGYEDLQKILNEEYADMKLKAHLNRYYNVMVGVKDIANMHNISSHTVTAYIKDGLIVPEVKLGENDHPKFRLSYALMLDFKELQKKLRANRRG